MKKRIVFALPGASYTNNFLISWTRLWTYCLGQGYILSMSNATCFDIYQVRNLAFGYKDTLPDTQPPVDGKDYDYIMCLDSDMVFTIPDFVKLLEADKEIISGTYKSTLGAWTCGMYDRQTGVSTPLKELKGIEKVDWAGMGFMLIKKGVLEKLGYPWFRPQTATFNGKTRYIWEDLGFCLRAKDNGFQVWVDADVKLGHEKRVII